MAHYTRSEWGADVVALQPMPKVPVSVVVLHHTATRATDDSRRDVKNIESGEQAQGYMTVAYNELGHPNGDSLDGRGITNKGAATLNRNSDTVAYAFIGNFQDSEPTLVALETCAQRLASWVKSGRVTKDFSLQPHSDFFATACCGKNLKPKIAGIRSRVTEILKGSGNSGSQPKGVPVTETLAFYTTVSTDDQGNGYCDVYHGKGKDPVVAIAQANGGIDKKTGYPKDSKGVFYSPVLWTAANDNAFVRVTVTDGGIKTSFGIKVLMGW